MATSELNRPGLAGSAVADGLDGSLLHENTASFDYLLKKIADAQFDTVPFKHIYIPNFFSDAQFTEIIAAPEITLKAATSDDKLFETLFENNYKIIDFPGCITNKEVYLKWHKEKKSQSSRNNSACEGFGMTLRLMKPSSPIITQLFEFMLTDRFQAALASKFAINRSEVRYDTGIQKYLDGYEISPHADVRSKALTYMININPGADAETRDHHTHYLKFREDHKYIQAYWEGNPSVDRFWVPWNWCETVKQQSVNNSLVIFQPDNDTLHGVRTGYNHLISQRTQMYGNLWYTNKKWPAMPRWEDFDFDPAKINAKPAMPASGLKGALPPGLKKFIKKNILGNDKNVLSDRMK